MLKNKAEEEVIKESFGEEFIAVVRALKRRKNFSEFKLAERIDDNVNHTRSLLYKLNQAGLADFIRKKDKKLGWYIYYWNLNLKSLKRFIVNLHKARIERLKKQIKNRGSGFFVCGKGCMGLDFDQAVNFDFKCPECGSLMRQEETEKRIDELNGEIKKLEKRMKAFS